MKLAFDRHEVVDYCTVSDSRHLNRTSADIIGPKDAITPVAQSMNRDRSAGVATMHWSR